MTFIEKEALTSIKKHEVTVYRFIGFIQFLKTVAHLLLGYLYIRAINPSRFLMKHHIKLLTLFTLSTTIILALPNPLHKKNQAQASAQALQEWQAHQKIFSEEQSAPSITNYQQATHTLLPSQELTSTEYEELFTKLTNNNEEQAFTLANNLFDYYIREHPLEFLQMHYQSKNMHLLKLIYTALWVCFGKKGWKHWHINSLEQLQQTKKEVIYIGGGFDFYQPLKYGVQNLTIIDPFLPEQSRYYPENYDYLFHGKKGKILDISALKKTLTCTYATSDGWFSLKTNKGYHAYIEAKTTTWKTAHGASITLNRRYFHQRDLEETKKTLFLISFNELFFFVAPSILGGWNINLSKLPEDIIILVKQLRTPLLKKDLITLRASLLLNACDVHFLALGNDVT